MSYLRFVKTATSNRVTEICDVRSARGGDSLGEIKWYGPWRQYCFFPLESAPLVFSDGCLRDIAGQIKKLAQERQSKREWPGVPNVASINPTM